MIKLVWNIRQLQAPGGDPILQYTIFQFLLPDKTIFIKYIMKLVGGYGRCHRQVALYNALTCYIFPTKYGKIMLDLSATFVPKLARPQIQSVKCRAIIGSRENTITVLHFGEISQQRTGSVNFVFS